MTRISGQGAFAEYRPTAHDASREASLLDAAGVQALLGEDIVAARKVLEPLSPEARQQLFRQPLGTTGQVPILAAAARGSTQMMALFRGMGAAINAQSPVGFDGVYTCLFNCKEDAAATLLRNKTLVAELRETEPIGFNDIADELATLPASPSDADLDALTDRFTGSGTKILSNTQSLALYLAHIDDADESPFINQAEAWNPKGALEARVRTLLAMIVTLPIGQERDALIREVAADVEAVRLDRRVFSIGQAKNPEVRRLALERECDSVLTKLASAVADGNMALTTLVIPVATPEHTMFMSLQPCYIAGKPHVLLHFDNRGAGYDAHTKPDKGRVYPIRTAVPATDAMYAHLRELLIHVLGERVGGSVDGVYAGIKEWVTAITVDLGAHGIEDPSMRELPSYRQVAGNCSLANQKPGLERRLGVELTARFREFEVEDVSRRLAESVTPAKVAAWRAAMAVRREQKQEGMV